MPDTSASGRALPTVRFGKVHAQPCWRGDIARQQGLPELVQTLLDPLAFHLLDGDAIGPGRSAGGVPLLPGPPQHSAPEEAVIQRMDPSVPAPVGR